MNNELHNLNDQNTRVDNAQNLEGHQLAPDSGNISRSNLVLANKINDGNPSISPEPLPQPENPSDLPPRQKISDIENFTEGQDQEQNLQVTCMKCNSELATNICIPCGHKVFCSKCSSKIRKNTETCPICDVIISSTVPIFAEPRCCICEKDCSSIFIPCGHKCCCYNCAMEIWSEKKTCPMCRKAIKTAKIDFPIC